MTRTCTSTLNKVVSYVYNETSNSDNALIEDTLMYDQAVLDFYLDCIEIKAEMDNIDLSPKDSTINSILEYSKNFRPTIFS